MTGAQLITVERRERKGVEDNSSNDLETAALRLITLVLGKSGHYPSWPDHWDEAVCDKMDEKTDFEKIQIAGAFLAASLDSRMADGCGPGKEFDEFIEAARPLMEHLVEYSPHHTAMVTQSDVILFVGVKGSGRIE